MSRNTWLSQYVDTQKWRRKPPHWVGVSGLVTLPSELYVKVSLHTARHRRIPSFSEGIINSLNIRVMAIIINGFPTHLIYNSGSDSMWGMSILTSFQRLIFLEIGMVKLSFMEGPHDGNDRVGPAFWGNLPPIACKKSFRGVFYYVYRKLYERDASLPGWKSRRWRNGLL